MDSTNNKTDQAPPAKGGDYLWDGSGQPDPEVQKLETLLGEFRYQGTTPPLPVIAPRRSWFSFARLRFPILAAATAAAVIAFVIYENKMQPTITTAGWEVSPLAGNPRIGRNTVNSTGATSHLSVGQVLETDNQSRASLEADNIGQIEIDPDSRLRLLTMDSGLKRLALDHGTIHAHIWAPPGQFVVDTPSAMTVDLGCAYTLHVDDSGAGLVRTSLGWVGFQSHGRESFIPAGAACPTRPNVGPGTPYFENASAELRAALSRFDFDDTTPAQRAADLAIILSQAGPQDSLTLWHLLSRVDETRRSQVFDGLNRFVPVPKNVTREGVLRLDQTMLDLWWNALGFDDISTWRHWEHAWSESAHGPKSSDPVARKP